jgi:catechol 2,3-dioxygenase-like lactoylglutathione lyase family enzyme
MTATTPLVTGVDFVSIPTKDLQESRDFYADVLGLEPSSVWQRPGADAVGAEFETGTSDEIRFVQLTPAGPRCRASTGTLSTSSSIITRA